MKNFPTLIAKSYCVSILALGLGCDGGSGVPSSAAVAVRFAARVDGVPLRLGAQSYTSPTGQGTFTVEDFKLYISNVALKNSEGGGAYVEKDSYHLARFDGDNNEFEFVLEGVGDHTYDSVEFAIGVDPVRNRSIENLRDLDPNNQMAWNWDVGYKFVLLEGTFRSGHGAAPVPLVYHVGFSENYKELAFNLKDSAQGPVAPGNKIIRFDIELMEMFRNPRDIDFNVLSSVKFDPDESRMFADNYADMIRLSAE